MVKKVNVASTWLNQLTYSHSTLKLLTFSIRMAMPNSGNASNTLRTTDCWP